MMLGSRVFFLPAVFAFTACGDGGLEGAWVACEDSLCTEVDNEGVLFGESGLAFSIEVDTDKPIAELSYCVETREQPIPWTLEEDRLEITEDPGDVEVFTVIVEDKLLKLYERDDIDDAYIFLRIDEDKHDGACQERPPVAAPGREG